jgi:hypothetical protein
MKKIKKKKPVSKGKLSDMEFLALIASEVKDRDLFPEKTAEAKKHVREMYIEGFKISK